mmetsp:Transcript_55844/g.141425  ORF Transcript_55844/g.141425 Transcript_55844/m.141425 type:complete len:202 (-) Transcript_55844:32-637(-)
MFAPSTSSTIENCGCSMKTGHTRSLRKSAADCASCAPSADESSSTHVASMSEFRVPKPLAALPNSFRDHPEPSCSMLDCSSLVQRSIQAFSSSDKAHSASLACSSDSSRARGPRAPDLPPRPAPPRPPYNPWFRPDLCVASAEPWFILLRFWLRLLWGLLSREVLIIGAVKSSSSRMCLSRYGASTERPHAGHSPFCATVP